MTDQAYRKFENSLTCRAGDIIVVLSSSDSNYLLVDAIVIGDKGDSRFGYKHIRISKLDDNRWNLGRSAE